MFMASVGKGDGTVDVFTYFLADRLGRTVADLDDMPASEFAAWQAYHKVRQQQEDMAVKAASHG